ncbi:MAG: DUF853 family protein, partial [Thermoguttaceae bacterium]|nr:DUF853 family protein [Thermoguttaceae bacterium]
LQVLAETFCQAGVPCFMADMKGDLSGISQVGKLSGFIQKRLPEFGIEDPQFQSCPVRFFDVYGEQGHPMRATISDMGPDLLGRLMELNETQTGVLNIVFKIADDNGLLLIDVKDLRAMLNFVGKNASDFTTQYGMISTMTIGAIQRALLALESQGADKFFGEPAFDIYDLLQCEGGKGVMNRDRLNFLYGRDVAADKVVDERISRCLQRTHHGAATGRFDHVRDRRLIGRAEQIFKRELLERRARVEFGYVEAYVRDLVDQRRHIAVVVARYANVRQVVARPVVAVERHVEIRLAVRGDDDFGIFVAGNRANRRLKICRVVARKEIVVVPIENPGQFAFGVKTKIEARLTVRRGVDVVVAVSEVRGEDRKALRFVRVVDDFDGAGLDFGSVVERRAGNALFRNRKDLNFVGEIARVDIEVFDVFSRLVEEVDARTGVGRIVVGIGKPVGGGPGDDDVARGVRIDRDVAANILPGRIDEQILRGRDGQT